MKIEIKQALLEGYNPEVIVEAVHANHPELNKKNSGNLNSRNQLANELKTYRKERSNFRNENRNDLANNRDNYSRVRSSTGAMGQYSRDPLSNNISKLSTGLKRMTQDPTMIKMVKNKELHSGLKAILPSNYAENSEKIESKLNSAPRVFTSAKQ